MPKVDLYNMEGQIVGDIDLNEQIFGIKPNEHTIYLAIKNQLANKRQGTQSTKTVSDIRGGGRKPWKQKGTGRARQGSIRNAQWTGGGVALGPKPRSYNYTIPKKVKRNALKSALSTKVLDKEIVVLDNLTLEEIKTKKMMDLFKKLNIEGTSLVVLPEKDERVIKSSNNIPGVKTTLVNTLNTYDIIKYNKFIITKDAVSKIEEVYA